MPERLTRKTVEFTRPFHLPGLEGEQPPGSYDVETVEEQIDGISFVAYRRVSTTILPQAQGRTPAARQMTAIDPGELAEAMQRDAEVSNGKS